MKALPFVCALFAAIPASAQELILPEGARQLTERVRQFERYDLPVGVFDGELIPVQSLEGQITARTWRAGVGSKTTLQVFDPLRAQIADAGFDIVLDCAAVTCGGFDFRFATTVVPSPDMYVAIRDYYFLSAVRGNEALSLLVSRNPPDAYIQTIHVTPVAEGASSDPGRVAPSPETVVPIAEVLQRDGHAILSGLDFGTGADTLGPGPFSALAELAQALRQTPEMRVALVGHTDNVGQLERNILLSKRRAEAVRSRLIEAYDIDGARLEAEGMGYLAPITSNATPEGRETNRRVEAVVLAP